MALNGRIPSSSLASIPGGRLRADAARAWNAMRAEIIRRGGPAIRPLGSNSSYRSYVAQQYFWSLYRSGRGNPAAYPGTSNHGWGRAVDVATPSMASWIIRVGRPYGWTHDEGARVGEWWHMSGVTFHAPSAFKALRRGARGRRVKWIQRRLRRNGYKSVPGPGKIGHGHFGRLTQVAAKKFQKAHGLPADGIVGKRTWTALARG